MQELLGLSRPKDRPSRTAAEARELSHSNVGFSAALAAARRSGSALLEETDHGVQRGA